MRPENTIAGFSNVGPKIDVAAPGVDILSLEAGTGGYVRHQGTSMAAPHVAGVAALIIERRPSFNVEQVRQALRMSATDLGPAGKDAGFGYGRLNAAAAVLIDGTLEARILSPSLEVTSRTPVPLTGTAQGPGFARYVVEWGAGANPTTWTTIRDSVTPVVAGDIGSFDTARADGIYTVRLRVLHSSGQTSLDQIQVIVRWVEITFPARPELVSGMHVMRPGQPLEIRGTAEGPSFQRFLLEWAPGFEATSGWSTANITLAGNGNAPVGNGPLGSWTPTPDQVGQFTLRLTVQNAGFTSQAVTGLYLEPDLIGSWPRFTAGTGMGQMALPLRQADGNLRMVICTPPLAGTTPACHSFAVDGTDQRTVPLPAGTTFLPNVADIDPFSPGQELVVAAQSSLVIFSADLTELRQIPVSGNVGSFDPTVVADLDGDQTPEILALVRRQGPLGFSDAAFLYVYRGDGTLYSPQYPVPVIPDGSPASVFQAHVVAADLDLDERKEILLSVFGRGGIHTIRAITAEGTPTSGFQFSATANAMSPVFAVDLDHDGGAEIIFFDSIFQPPNPEVPKLWVLDRTGAPLPGWPQPLHGGPSAFGDLDRDGRDEILVRHDEGLDARKLDGTRLSGAWPLSRGLSGAVIADIDDDGIVEVLSGDFSSLQLSVFRPDASFVRAWMLHGWNGRGALGLMTGVGDFNGDGLTELATHSTLSDGSFLVDGVVTLLNARTSFNAVGSPWPFPYGDPAQSHTREPGLRLGPLADAYVRDGASAGTNFGQASSLEVKTTSSAGANRIAYLRFPIQRALGPVVRAKLRLFGNRSMTSAAADSVYAVTSDAWDELGINWNNRPALGAKQGGGVVVGTGARYWDWDVTSFVRAQEAAGDDEVSLAVRMDVNVSHGPDQFNAREATSNRPTLIVEVGPNNPPRIVAGPTATPDPVVGTTTALSVTATDDQGETGLGYLWTPQGPDAVDLSENSSNAAKNTIATFHSAGSYLFEVFIHDANGQSVLVGVPVTVAQTFTSVAVTPATAAVQPGATQAFSAIARDQFGNPMDPQPAFVWTVSGGGSIDASGVFTAGSTAGGPFTVTAAAGGKQGTALVTVGNPTTTTTLAAVADAYVRDGTSAGTNFGQATSLAVKTTSSAGNNRITYLRFPLTGISGTVTAATLRLHGSRPVSSTATDSAFAVSSNSWTESGINWNNKPALGASQGSPAVVTPDAGYHDWDVTAFVNAQKSAGATAVSLAVKMNQNVSHGPDTFSSDEAASNRPQLVVTTSSP
jgi:hypothetical protein